MTKSEELEHILPRLRSAVLVTAERFFGKGAEEAEDVTQEVLLIWLRREEIRTDEVEALAHTIARNLCVSVYRRQKKCVGNMERLPEDSHDTTPIKRTIENDNQRLLLIAINELPPAWQRILRMQAETDMSTRQIAAVLGIKPESVSVMLSSARRRLYETLKPLTII